MLTPRDSIEKVRALLHEIAVADGMSPNVEASIITWKGEEALPPSALIHIGIRVSEVTFSVKDTLEGPSRGSSYLASDGWWGLAICAQVERTIIEIMLEDPSEIERETYTLRSMLLDPPLDPDLADGTAVLELVDQDDDQEDQS